ncbi:MAG TPA: hypothetical protein ENN46_03045 [Candidatus Woesearchaeota archaeon]|nr:hypothetical protein [Candidatus Woesearchaeota archaeon]
MKRLFTNGKTMILAYDQGLEHGPVGFNNQSVDPDFVFRVGAQAGYNAIATQIGIAEKYYGPYKEDLRLLVKLNGKTNLLKGDPCSPLNCSVRRAVKAGAVAVGYTVYVGSLHETEIFHEFSKIVEEARGWDIPVVAWVYPRGEAIENELDTNTLAYAARVALELGADVAKIKFNGDPEGFKWIARCAGKTGLVMAGGEKRGLLDFFRDVKMFMDAGGKGIAVGRNVWQSDKPVEVSLALKKIIFNDASPEEAFELVKG